MAKPKTKTTVDSPVTPALDDPLAAGTAEEGSAGPLQGPYDLALAAGEELRRKPYAASSTIQTIRQHAKDRMTVWERIEVLQDPDSQPTILYQNWGPNLDGASIVTAVIKIRGRDVALYGHDFTVRAGSMDATNGRKLANLIYLAGERGIPLIGMNDSAGAFVPAGIGGLDGYAEAFTALRKISGVVPSIMCMFGFNAGGGSYLPRQGSFMIQPDEHLLRPHRPGRRQERARRGRDAGRARRSQGARRERRRRPDGGGRGRRAAHGAAPAQLPAQLEQRGAALPAHQRLRSSGRRPRSTPCCARRSTRRPASTRRSTSPSSSSASATTATTSSCSPTARATRSPPSAASAATSSASSPTTAPSPAARSTSTPPTRSPASSASARSTTSR